MMRKIDRTGGAFSRCSSEKALRRLLGAAVVVLMLCLVFAMPAAAVTPNVYITEYTYNENDAQVTSVPELVGATYSSYYKEKLMFLLGTSSSANSDYAVFGGAAWPIPNAYNKYGSCIFKSSVNESNYPTGKVTIHTSMGCMAYASYCTVVFEDVTISKTQTYGKNYSEDVTVDEMKSFVQSNVQVGEHIRFIGTRVSSDGKTHSKSHSIIYLVEDADGNGFYFLDSNGVSGQNAKFKYTTYDRLTSYANNYDASVFVYESYSGNGASDSPSSGDTEVMTPGMFEILSPLCEQVFTSVSPVSVTWSASEGAVGYRFALRDLTDNVKYLDNVWIDDTTTYTIDSQYLTAGHEYRFAVAACDADNESVWVESLFSIFGEDSSSDTAIIISPAEDSVLQYGSDVTVSWSPVSYADFYEITLLNAESGDLVSSDLVYATTSHTFAASQFSEQTRYCVGVIAYDEEGGKHGYVRYFTIGEDNVPEPETGHSCNSITEWQPLSSAPADISSGTVYYYLENDIELSDTWIISKDADVHLCLNGHNISCTEYFSGISIYGASFSLYDCIGTGSISGSKYFAVCVYSGCFNMYGGTIKDSSSSNGGGVSVSGRDITPGVYVNGTFNMFGGCIENCTAEFGGGVSVGYHSTITLSGGRIENCTAEFGGGVYVDSDCTITMSGGRIENCSAVFDADYTGKGGGIYVARGGSFIMSGGSISNCSADYYGGGAYIDSGGNLTISDGIIDNCHAESGGGVYVYGKNLTMIGGIIKNCRAENYGGGLSVLTGTFTFSGGSIVCCSGYNGGGVDFSGSVFTMSGGSIDNCSATKFGGGVFSDGDMFTMYSGSSIKNTSAESGGGVYVNLDSTFNMSGGSIENCNAVNGGGVYVNRGNFTMFDGGIENCSASYGCIHLGTGEKSHITFAGSVDVSDICIAISSFYPTGVLQADESFTGSATDISILKEEECVYVTALDTLVVTGGAPYASQFSLNETLYSGLTLVASGNDLVIGTAGSKPTPTPTPVEEIIVRSAADFADALNADLSGNVVTLTNDVTIVNPIYIVLNAGEEIILTTAGDYSLYRGVADNPLIMVIEGTLTLEGKDSASQLTIDGRKEIYTENTDSLISVCGTLILCDNAILTNNAADYGAGVSVENNGHFEMRGGEISNNYVRIHYSGAGVDVSGEIANYDSEGQVTSVEYGYFNMSGGRICNNEGVGLFNYGITTISGGEISNNTDSIISGGGELSMTGGTILNNDYGITLFDGYIGLHVDGDIVYRDTIGKLFISGDMVIPASERVWIDKNSTIIVTGPLSANAGIYNIHTSKESGVIVNATASKITGEDLLSHFVLNEDGYSLTSDGYTLVLSPASTEPIPILNMLLSKTSVNKGDSLRVYGETTLPAGTNLTLRLVAGNIQDEDTEVVDAFFLYVQEGDAEMNTWSTQYDTSALEAGEYFFIIFATDNPDVVFNTASFAVTESTTPTPEKPAAPTLTPPESLPEDATVTTNTVAETNAATKAEVGYQVNPADVTTMKAPTITRGKLSVQLNEGVKVVKTLADGNTVEVEATVNEDGSINLPSGALDDAAAVTVNFIGRQFGDVTNDGKPDTLDAARVLQASVGLFDFSGADTFYGDVSGDGFANTLDAARILQYSVSLVDENYVTKA